MFTISAINMRIAIAGAGLIGRLLAWQCLKKGWSVDIFDKDNPTAEQSTAWVAAAMLSPASESVNSHADIYTMGRKSLELWPNLLKQLEEETQQTVSFKNAGTIVLAHPQDYAHFEQFKTHLRLNEKTRNSYNSLDSNSLKKLEPILGENFSHALHLKEEACLDNRELLSALEIALTKNNKLTWHTNTFVSDASPYKVTYSKNLGAERICAEYDLVVDARGAGAEKSNSELRGVRGEIIWIRADEVKLSHAIRLMHPRYQIYIAPHAGNVFAIGATEIESNDSKKITVRSSLELLSALFSVSSRFAEAEIIGSYARIRPAFNDNLPRISNQAGLMSINGLYRHGYLLAPVITQDAISILNNEPHAYLIWPSRYTELTQ